MCKKMHEILSELVANPKKWKAVSYTEGFPFFGCAINLLGTFSGASPKWAPKNAHMGAATLKAGSQHLAPLGGDALD